MPDDDLLPPAVPAVVVAPVEPVRGSGRICCEFCGCELDPKGNVLKRGEPARAYLDLEDRLKHANAQIDTLRASESELAGQLEALRTPVRGRGFLDL